MRTFDLAALSLSEGGEYVLGKKDLHSQACYFVYGTLQPGEGERLIRPGHGYEEILCAVGGPLTLHTAHGDIRLDESHAIHVKETDSFLISNPSSDQAVVYVMAGGHVRPDI
ncbi:MAG: hypothetical protein AB1733_10260 [Thermodesulfobacteriota bacterium]